MRIKRSFVAAIALCLFPASSAYTAFLTVYGGPAYDQTAQTGYQSPYLPTNPGSSAGSGMAVGNALKYASGTVFGSRAVRWDASGMPATELGNLGTTAIGTTNSTAWAVNTAGTAVGYARKYTAGGADLGQRAVRWDASGTAATELDNLGTDNAGSTFSGAYALNAFGAAVGYAEKYLGIADLGPRAVRWDAAGTAATELGNLGTDINGNSNSFAYSINSAGTIVGSANKYTNFTNLGPRAVRWDPSGVVTELGNIGTADNGFTNSQGLSVNATGAAVGYAQKYNAGINVGYRGVRWDASGMATELGNLGTDLNGKTTSYAYMLNSAGTAVGYADKYVGTTVAANRDIGPRAVRWDASGAAATELGNLGTDTTGVTSSDALAINTAGIAVGDAQKYTAGGTLVGQRGVLWNADAIAIDLNTLIDPASGWTLTEADAISDTNWVTGIGSFDPDGPAGPLAAYDRAFLLDVSSILPEPVSIGIICGASTFLILRRSRRRPNGEGAQLHSPSLTLPPHSAPPCYRQSALPSRPSRRASTDTDCTAAYSSRTARAFRA
jgi:hypothetical protein